MMEIHRARAKDAPALARVHVDSWRAAYGGLVPDSSRQAFSYEWREEQFRQSLAAGAEETHLIRVEGEVVGFLTLGAARDSDLDTDRTGEIWGIYISPGYWRRGIGQRLAEEAQRMLRSRGYEDAVLWVLEGNQQARAFYEAVGFALDGQSNDLDWGTPLKAIRYRKALQPAGQTGP
jgi:ribosomal protein S18 acetylase RimI-like enzyme